MEEPVSPEHQRGQGPRPTFPIGGSHLPIALRRLASAMTSMVVLATLFAGAPRIALADGNTIKFTPTTVSARLGVPFTLNVVGSSSTKVSGTAATVSFDPARLRLIRIAKGAEWSDAGASWAGYPTTGDLTTRTRAWSDAGKTGLIAAYVTSADQSLAAGDHTFLTLTFVPIALFDATTVTAPIGPLDGSMQDGADLSLSLTLTASGGATVSSEFVESSPTPSPTPSPCASPGAFASPSPTVSPSGSPCPSPTPSPCASPGASASPSPTVSPSGSPCPSPTVSPTGAVLAAVATAPPTSTAPAPTPAPDPTLLTAFGLIALALGLLGAARRHQTR